MSDVDIALEIFAKTSLEDILYEMTKNKMKNIKLEKKNKKLNLKNEKCLDLICSYHIKNEDLLKEKEVDKLEIDLLKRENKNLNIKIEILEIRLQTREIESENRKIDQSSCASSEITICCLCSKEEICRCDCHIQTKFEKTKKELKLL